MPLRHQDPTTGRWNGIDPVTHFSSSTYAGYNNNPVYWADPSGACAVCDWVKNIFRDKYHFSPRKAGSGGSSLGGFLTGLAKRTAEQKIRKASKKSVKLPNNPKDDVWLRAGQSYAMAYSISGGGNVAAMRGGDAFNPTEEDDKKAASAFVTIITTVIAPEEFVLGKVFAGTLFLIKVGSVSVKGLQLTAIGRMATLKKYANMANVDTWHKSGPGILPGKKYITWTQNRIWLDARIAKGDTFIMTMDPSKLPKTYIKDSPNGWFTKLEYDYLVKKGAKILNGF